MIWTAQTPLYLPLTYGDNILRATHRLADDVGAAFGARPELRPQPAPFGQPAILISPDPAYTSAIAPAWSQTFVAQTEGPELTVTGADGLGTILGLAWLSTKLLGEGAGPQREFELHFELPRWADRVRAWSFTVGELAEQDLGELCWALLKHGGNTLGVVSEVPAEVSAAAAELGLKTAAVETATGRTDGWW